MKISGVHSLSVSKCYRMIFVFLNWLTRVLSVLCMLLSPLCVCVCVCVCLEIFYFFEVSESGIRMFKRIETIVLVLVLNNSLSFM